MEYTLKRKHGQKNLRMHISDKGEIIVSVPYYTPKSEIDSFVNSHSEWIEKHLQIIPKHSYDSEDSIPLFGEKRRLLVIKGNIFVMHNDESILVSTLHPENIEIVKKMLRAYYGEILLKDMLVRISYWCNKMKISEPKVEISNAKSFWGICYTTKKLVKFSALSAALNERLREMLVVHELCHLRYADHSVNFWNLVRTYIPDADEREKELRNYSRTGIVKNLF